MLSKEDQRRFDEITRNLRTSDPEFVARLSARWDGRLVSRRARLMLMMTVLLWVSVPAVVVLGGWLAAAVAPLMVAAAGVLVWQARRHC